nr:Uncharacterized protein conserved in bacteria (DUF2248) [uncultured bacterium]
MILTAKSIDQALTAVIRDLERVGLLTERLYSVEVYRHVIDVRGCFGLYVEDCGFLESILGFKPRSIYIPQVSWARVRESLQRMGRGRTSLRDVLRHEYGHAFAVEHPNLVRKSKSFQVVFGAAYDDQVPPCPYDPNVHVSPYAATAPYEDFAETFMLYVKYGGKIDRFKKRPIVYKKMQFIQKLALKLKQKQQAQEAA